MIWQQFFHVLKGPPYIVDIKTDKLTILNGETTSFTYDGRVSDGAKYNPRELFLHFDGTNLTGAMGNFYHMSDHGHYEGWSTCLKWNLNVASGIILLLKLETCEIKFCIVYFFLTLVKIIIFEASIFFKAARIKVKIKPPIQVKLFFKSLGEFHKT